MSLTSPTATTKRRRTDSVSIDDKGVSNTAANSDVTHSNTAEASSLVSAAHHQGPVHIPKRGARACTACRKGKNRCEGEAPCRRCQLSGTQCIFEKPDKKNVAPLPNGAFERMSRLESQFLVMQSTVIGMQSSLDRILTAIQIQSPNANANPNLTLTAVAPSSATASTSSQSFSPVEEHKKFFPPLPGFAPPPHKYATYGIVPSTAPSSDDESEDTLPRSTMNAPIEALQGLANAAAEAAAAAVNAPLPVPPRVKKKRRAEPIPRNAFPSVLEKGLVSETEAQELYHIFFSGCHLFIPLFDPAYDTYEGLKERTPFCFDAILAVASKIRSGNGPPTSTFFKCLEEAQGIARSTLFGPIVRKEAVQAMLLLSAWSTNGWLPCGHAMRMALDLGLHRALDKLADSGNIGSDRNERGGERLAGLGNTGGGGIERVNGVSREEFMESGRNVTDELERAKDIGEDIEMPDGGVSQNTDIRLNGSRARARSMSGSARARSPSGSGSITPPPMNSSTNQSQPSTNSSGNDATRGFINFAPSSGLKKRSEEEERDLVVSARIWLCLYWFDHQLSLGTGRPIVLRNDNSIRHCRLLLSHPMSSPTDVRLVAQIELIIQKTQIYETLSSLVSDRQGNNNIHNSPSPVALIRRAQVSLEKWWAEWDGLHASQGHPPNSLLRKILSSELHYAKLWLVCVALRGASWDKLPFEQREMAFQAKEAATRCVEAFLGCAEYRAALRYAVHDSLVTAAFSGLFLLKMAHLFPAEVDIIAIATQVEQLAGLLSDVAAERYALTLRLMLINLRRKMGIGFMSPSYGHGGASIPPSMSNSIAPPPSQSIPHTQMNMVGSHVRPHSHSQSIVLSQQHGMGMGHNVSGMPLPPASAGTGAGMVVPPHPHNLENLSVSPYMEQHLSMGMANMSNSVPGMISPYSNHLGQTGHHHSPSESLPPLNTEDLGFIWPSDADGGVFSPSVVPLWLQEQSLSDLGIPIDGVQGIFLNVNGPNGWNGDFVSMPEAW